MSEAAPKDRVRPQIHLSTAVALMVVIGGLIGFWLWTISYFGEEVRPKDPAFDAMRYKHMALFACVLGAGTPVALWLTVALGESLARRFHERAQKSAPPV